MAGSSSSLANHANCIRQRRTLPSSGSRVGLGGRNFLRLRVSLSRREKEIRFEAVLLRVEIVIAAAGGKERLVRAALDDASRFDDENLVGAADRRESMRNHKSCPPAHEIAEPLLDQRLGFGIEAGSGFVENQNARV